MPIVSLTTFLLLLTLLATGQSPARLDLMPMPSSVQFGKEKLLIKRSFSVAVSGYRDGTLDRGVQRFIAEVSHETGMRLDEPNVTENNAVLLIHAQHGRESAEKVDEDESYELTVSGSNAKLTAPNPLGILHGLQTFLQLLTTGADGCFGAYGHDPG